MSRTWKSRAAAIAISATMVVPALALASSASAAKGGNSANAKACQKGGWEKLVRADRTPFANQDACVSYGAQGGTLTTPTALPDLIPEVRCTPDGNGWRCDVDVTNVGLAVASGFVSASGTVTTTPATSTSSLSGSAEILLAPGETASLAGGGVATGTVVTGVDVQVTVDTTNAITESNETNNTISQNFTF